MKFDNFISRMNCISDFKSRCGQKVEPLYGVKSDDPEDIGIIGETDTDALIQSYALETDIHVMIQRFIDGDQDAFSYRQGFYGDVSNMPEDMHTIKKMSNDAKLFYESMPEDIKEKYSIDEFYKDFGSESFNSFMDSVFNSGNDVDPPVGNDPVGSEVKVDAE